jgi:hypothetical protein
MKLQTGVRIESEVWAAYREICSRENLRPSLTIEEFLRLVIETDSALSTLNIMRVVAKGQVGGFDAYVRVLLDWFTHDKFWFYVGNQEEQTSVESLLLDSLKTVSNSELRKQIEEALIANQRKKSP